MKNSTKGLMAGLLAIVATAWFGGQAQAGSHVLIDDRPAALANPYSPAAPSQERTLAATARNYRIVAHGQGNGRVSPAGVVAVKQGEVRSFAFLPAPGYRVSALRVDGELFETVDSYTFINISSDHAIEVIFAADQEPALAALANRK